MEIGSICGVELVSKDGEGIILSIGEPPRQIIIAQNAFGQVLGPFESLGAVGGEIAETNRKARAKKMHNPISIKKLGAIALSDEALTDGWEIIAVFEEPLENNLDKETDVLNALFYVCLSKDDKIIGDDTMLRRFYTAADALQGSLAAKEAMELTTGGPGGL